ncbi:MAG: hypothetical protein H5U08_11970 [Thermogutta sp.]|uniref:hypothetical protein n=1 Tax=Thermogutta sp. TaxID=1962930 RepID=UPI00199F2D42|nr:hypothetical protein [Thermogutta sp.]MBC7353068.1 hypothetical protein [Thermogutta sp.]
MQRAARFREKLLMRRLRRGAVATLDYILLIGVILPAAAFTMWAGPRIIRLAYEMVYVLIVWPFM